MAERAGIAVFSTGHLPLKQQFGAWRDYIDAIYDVTPAGRQTGFGGSNTTATFGSVLIGATRMSAQTFVRDHRKIAQGGGDAVIFQYFAKGGEAIDCAGREDIVRPGDVFVNDLSQPSTCRTVQSVTYSIVVPRSLIEARVNGAGDLHGTVLRARTPVARVIGNHISTLAAVMEHAAGDGQAAALSLATIDLVAHCLRPLGYSWENTVPAAATLDRIKRYIDANLASPDLGPERVCRDLGLSRSSLYRLCEPLGGIAAHIQMRRLERAREALRDPSQRTRKVADIAYHWHFSSEANFSRAFRRVFGISPREVRGLPQEPIDDRFERLVRHLHRVSTE